MGPVGTYQWDEMGLPEYEYTGTYPVKETDERGADARLPEDPCFILGNSRITAFAHVSGQLELITGERGWARINHTPGNGYWNQASLNGYVLAGSDPVPQKKQFGVGFALYQAQIGDLRITRKIAVPPSNSVKGGVPAAIFRVAIENTGKTSVRCNYEESMLANYCMLSGQEMLDGADPKAEYRGIPERWGDSSVAAVQFCLVPKKLWYMAEPGESSPLDGAPPALYIKRLGRTGQTGVVQTAVGNALRYSAEVFLAPGEQCCMEYVVGVSFEKGKDLPCESWAVDARGASCLWKRVLPDFALEEDASLRWEMIWNAYVLYAMATYHQYFDETMIPQGSVYAYRLGQNASMRDHLQHAVSAAYVWPELAKSNIRFVLAHMRRDGRILRQDIGFGYEDAGIYFESDPQLYLFMAVGEYLRITGDIGFLGESFRFYPKEEGSGTTVLDGLIRAFLFLRDAVGIGRHGLVMMRNSDWSDSFFHTYSPNLYCQVAESHMNTTMALAVIPGLIQELRKAEGMVTPDENKTIAQLAGELQDYRDTLYKAFLRDMEGRDYAPRCYIGFDDNPELRFGEDRLCLEAQIWLLQLEDFPEERKQRLWKLIREKLIEPEKLGARTRERPLWNPEEGIGEDGGIWFAHQGPLMVGVASIDPDAARGLMNRLTFHHMAQSYPRYWLGQWTSADSVESTLSKREGLYHAWCDHVFQPYCAHAHAWMLYVYCRLFYRGPVARFPINSK